MSKFFVYRIAATIPTGTSKMMEQDVLSDESSTVATPLYVPTGVTRYMQYHLPVDWFWFLNLIYFNNFVLKISWFGCTCDDTFATLTCY